MGELLPEEQALIAGLRRAANDSERWKRLLDMLLTEDEADLIISRRREQQQTPLPWGAVKSEILKEGNG